MKAVLKLSLQIFSDNSKYYTENIPPQHLKIMQY
jgi:hypothetical protein